MMIQVKLNNLHEPGEKFEFPLLMHEINVLPVELSWLIYYIYFHAGGYPELNRELTVPHTVVLPIELYPP